MFRIVAFLMTLAVPTAVQAMPDGGWTCSYSNPEIKQVITLNFVGGRLIFDRGDGRNVVSDVAMNDAYAFWKVGAEYEFYPKESRMVRTTAAGKDDLTCIKQ